MCWLLLIHIHTLSIFRHPLSGINLSSVSCFGKVVILLGGEITMDSQIHFLLSIIQMWPRLIIHGNVLSSVHWGGGCVRVCLCACVFTSTLYSLTPRDHRRPCGSVYVHVQILCQRLYLSNCAPVKSVNSHVHSLRNSCCCMCMYLYSAASYNTF